MPVAYLTAGTGWSLGFTWGLGMFLNDTMNRRRKGWAGTTMRQVHGEVRIGFLRCVGGVPPLRFRRDNVYYARIGTEYISKSICHSWLEANFLTWFCTRNLVLIDGEYSPG